MKILYKKEQFETYIIRLGYYLKKGKMSLRPKNGPQQRRKTFYLYNYFINFYFYNKGLKINYMSIMILAAIISNME